MTMTDPVADMLTRLRNANSAHHDSVSMPNSQAQGPHRRDPQARGLHRRLGGRATPASARPSRCTLKFGPNRERSIAGIKRVSKPGLRVYAKSTEIPKVLGGLGVAILSTSSGLLTDRQAEQEGRGWGSPRLRVVICHVTYRTTPHRHPRRRRRRRSTARPSPSRAPRASSRSPWPRPIEVKVEEGQVLVTRPDDERESRSLHGLTRTLIANQIIGVTEGYSKGLEIVGTGYRVAQKGSLDRVRARLLAPRDRRAARRHHASRSRATTSSPSRGIDKQAVGETAANIRKITQARALQGQGHPLRRRGRASQGRKDW